MTAKIKLNAASGGGSFSLQAPSSSSNNRVFTLPDSADATILTSTTATGKILQVEQTYKQDTASTTSTSFGDISGMSVSITPSSSSNKVLVMAMFKAVSNDVTYVALTTGDGTPIIQASGSGYTETPAVSIHAGGNSGGEAWYGTQHNVVIKLDSPNTTSAVTYKLRWRVNSGTGYFNRNMDMGAQYNVAVASTITAFEVEG